MAEITLADYTGHLLLEVIKARQMADDYSRRVALSYAEDPVLRHFPAPRFKLPKVELTIPVLVSSVRVSQLARFNMRAEAFVALVQGRCKDVVTAVQAAGGNHPLGAKRAAPRGHSPRGAARSAAVDGLIRDFYEQLRGNPDPAQPGNIVRPLWSSIFEGTLLENRLGDIYKRTNPRNELLTKTTAELLESVNANTVIERTTIDSLLVNPETNAVKNGTNDASVFTIRAELVEEGVHVRSVKDESTGEAKSVVEFE
ncbi:MAG: hypothetical protein EXS08_02035 [Planctomycetes bacterium]|nr:hypothetical protein [Planctomycetota bacterium]